MSDAVNRHAPSACRVAVTGDAGPFGEAVLVAFAKAGHHTSSHCFRNDEAAARLTDTFGVTGLRADLSGEFDMPVVDFDVLVNCAEINTSEEQAHAVDPGGQTV
jgi:shikimate 5-dehydrogenase